jgi:ADP-heptose:LPS heptosyltransferase
MEKIIISRRVQNLINGNRSAKDYPYWEELVTLLKPEYEIIEIDKEIPLPELEELIKSSLTVIAPDSFIQHFCWSIGKKAIVLWGVGDPSIFGHAENINLIKSRNNLRKDQFNFWWDVPYKPEVFVTPAFVVKTLKENFK